jgi:hypothetical protein
LPPVSVSDAFHASQVKGFCVDPNRDAMALELRRSVMVPNLSTATIWNMEETQMA